MPRLELVASAIVGLVVSVGFLLVGALVHRRSRIEEKMGLSWFAVFWVGIGTYGLAEALWALAHLLGADGLPLALFFLHVKVVASVAAFGGLVSYVLLIRGVGRRAHSVVVGLYGLLLALTETFYSWRTPVGVVEGDWGMRLAYARPDADPWWTLLLVLLFFPPILATLAYAMLVRHARDRGTRYRIALTSASLGLFFVPLLLGWQAGGWPWWGAVEKTLSVAMACGVAMALWPPEPVRAWIHGVPSRRTARRIAFDQRVRDLV